MAELLIALVILGVIAASTIPMLIGMQQNQRYNAMAKEAFSSVAGTWEVMKARGTGSQSTTPGDILRQMNYVTLDTTSNIDDLPGGDSSPCDPIYFCTRMHNGGILKAVTTGAFAGTNTTNAVFFLFDPDGVYGGATNGSSKSLKFALYYDGFVTDRGNVRSGTLANGIVYPGSPGGWMPVWFSY